jgi:heme/copper-type cytochrome/quinol oxidase subunit 3
MSDTVAPSPDRAAPLPVGAVGRIGVGWWGAVCFIVSEASLFGYLLFAYLYDAVKLDGNFLPAGGPSLKYAFPGILLLLASSLAAWWAERAARDGQQAPLQIGFAAALLCGVAFLVLQWLDWQSETITLRSDTYGSMFYVITGIHAAHLVVALIGLSLVELWSALGYFDARRHVPVLIAAFYWHFVVAAGVGVFVVIYLTPFLW